MKNNYTDDELIAFSNGWSKLPKYARLFVQFLLKSKLDEKGSVSMSDVYDFIENWKF